MVCSREEIAHGATEEKEEENDGIVRAGGSVVVIRVKAPPRAEDNHPDSSKQVRVDVAGLVMSVKHAFEAV